MKLFLIMPFVLSSHAASEPVDNIGPGHALYFDGTNGYVDLASHFQNLELPFTISAWVYLDPSQADNSAPVFRVPDAFNFLTNNTIHSNYISTFCQSFFWQGRCACI